MAIAGLSLGAVTFITLPCLISILLPALSRAREQANRIKCASDMKMIGAALQMYSNDNNGAYPPSLDRLLAGGYITSANVFVCPSSNDMPASGQTPQAVADNLATPGHLSYVYLGKGLDSGTAGANTVLVYEALSNHRSQGMNVLYGDGSVRWVAGAAAQQLITSATSPPAPPATSGGGASSP